MTRHDPEIYPGTYVTCVFNPDKALCRPHATATATDVPSMPAVLDCRPLECRNVALTPDNITTLTAEADHLDIQARTRPTLPPLLIADIQRRCDAIRTFLNTIGTTR